MYTYTYCLRKLTSYKIQLTYATNNNFSFKPFKRVFYILVDIYRIGAYNVQKASMLCAESF